MPCITSDYAKKILNTFCLLLYVTLFHEYLCFDIDLIHIHCNTLFIIPHLSFGKWKPLIGIKLMDVISTEFMNQPTSMFITDQQENTYFHEKTVINTF
jgi:hypothetical protein